MAISLKDRYPNNTNAASPDYPHGSARNVTTPGDNTGTPYDEAIVNDVFGFLQAALETAGVAPSGSPDTAQVSQYLDAIVAAARYTDYDSPVAPKTPVQRRVLSIDFADTEGTKLAPHGVADAFLNHRIVGVELSLKSGTSVKSSGLTFEYDDTNLTVTRSSTVGAATVRALVSYV